MSAVFPILKRDGSAYANLTEFKQDLNKSTSGRYILSTGHGWHGGVHLNSQSFPWGKGLRSIQAMLGGKVAAYRINDDYVSSEYMGKTFKFSNNFVLLEHEYADPTEGSDKVFTFYTLYMHLAPPSAIGVNAEFATRYKMDAEKTKVRSFATSGVPDSLGTPEKTVSLPLGTEFEYLDADSKTYRSFSINNTVHAMIRCKLLTNNSDFVDKEVWIASGNGVDSDTSRFNFLNTPGGHLALTTPEPEWMTGSDIKRDGSVVAIKKPDGEDTRISIDAGSDLGYLSLNEFSQDSNATKQHEYVVHIEMFSIDKPEEYFLKQFENMNQTPIDGTVSDGAVKPGNPLFSQLVTLTSEEADSTPPPTTTEALITRLNGKREKLEKLIVQHQSEWCQDSANTHLESIKESAKKVLDRLFENSFISRDEYKDSKWHNKLEEVYQSFFAQQQEKAKLLAWIQDASDVIHANPKPYYFWPYSFGPIDYICQCEDVVVKCTRYHAVYGPVVWGTRPLSSITDNEWSSLELDGNVVTQYEKDIIIAMSPNEGKLDSVQSYDNQLITAGAMQKTIRLDGDGELVDQILEFKALYPDNYEELFSRSGWHISAEEVYFSHSAYKSGARLSGTSLRSALREGLEEKDLGKVIDCLPVKNLACSIRNPLFIKKQLEDFVTRIRVVKGLTLSNYNNISLEDLFRSKLGIATALDHHINRPNNVVTEINDILDEYFSLDENKEHNNINDWGDDEHSTREREILDLYGVSRNMTDAVNRYNNLVRRLGNE